MGLTAELVVGTVFFLIPYNLLMYGINDVFDYESDLRNPRKGGVEGIVLASRWHRLTLWWACLLPVPFVLALLWWGPGHQRRSWWSPWWLSWHIPPLACGSRSVRWWTP